MTSILKYTLKPAGILAVVLTAAYLILFYASKENYIHPKSGIVMMVITTVVVVWTGFRMAVRHQPRINYVQAWVFTFAVITLGTLGYYLSEMLVYNVVAPALPQYIEDWQMRLLNEQLSVGAIDQSYFDTVLPDYEAIDSSYAPKWVLLRGLWNLVYWLIPSLVMAFFIFNRAQATKN